MERKWEGDCVFYRLIYLWKFREWKKTNAVSPSPTHSSPQFLNRLKIGDLKEKKNRGEGADRPSGRHDFILQGAMKNPHALPLFLEDEARMQFAHSKEGLTSLLNTCL